MSSWHAETCRGADTLQIAFFFGSCLRIRLLRLSRTLYTACHPACSLKKPICCRCEEAKAELQRQPLPGSCECMKMDLGDFASVRAFANGALKQLQAQHKKIQILVNNAG